MKPTPIFGKHKIRTIGTMLREMLAENELYDGDSRTALTYLKSVCVLKDYALTLGHHD